MNRAEYVNVIHDLLALDIDGAELLIRRFPAILRVYITGDITSDYLQTIESRRDAARDSGDDEGAQLDLNLATAQ